MGLFLTENNEMAAFLKKLGGDPSPMPAFVARNFLLDEGVTGERYKSYSRSRSVADHKSYADWGGTHESYLTDHIWRPGNGMGPPARLDPNNTDICPEPFRAIDADSPFHQSDLNLYLVRVEKIESIATKSNVTADRIKKLAQAIVNGTANQDSKDYKDLADVLKTWSLNIDIRPVFSGYWQNVRDLFEPDEKANWADTLRDRLGLLHLNPTSRACPSIDVVVFRYPVSTVPSLDGLKNKNSSRPLVPPTVLDGRHSVAFCPAPHGESTGYTIDLGQDSPPLRQEVLHPTVGFSPDHVFRVGTIRQTINEAMLPEARGWHLLAVREHTGRSDYAAETDADLLDL